MRPIDKGRCPQENGKDKTVSQYRDWRKDLIDRIGYYCVYCNIPLSHQLHVEHVVPKAPLQGSPVGSLLNWENMLLACEKCNKSKSNKPSAPSVHYLPEYHNGLLPFVSKTSPKHPNALLIGVKSGLNPAQQTKAQKTIDDFELENIDIRGAIVDIRWMKRWNAKLAVQSALYLLQMAKSSPTTYNAALAGKHIATIAAEIGFFILWFETFHHEPEVLRSLIDSSLIPGTDPKCFDPTSFQPVPRNPSNSTDPF